jgi:hypothetical protein
MKRRRRETRLWDISHDLLYSIQQQHTHTHTDFKDESFGRKTGKTESSATTFFTHTHMGLVSK